MAEWQVDGCAEAEMDWWNMLVRESVVAQERLVGWKISVVL